MTEAEKLMIAATFGGALLGPFLAVIVTRLVDDWRDQRGRKNAIYDALMSTRRAVLTPEHVQAVNRIELEFSKNNNVMTTLRAYMNLLEDPYPTERDAQDLLNRRRRRAFADLVQAIGQSLGRRVDRLDIIEGGYHPGGWAETEVLQLQNLRLINGILRGDFGLPVQAVPLRPTPPAGATPPPTAGPAAPPPPPPSVGPQPGEPGSPFPPAP